MFVRTSVRFTLACVALCAALGSGAAIAQNGSTASGASISLTAQRHDGAEAIDIYGRARPSSRLYIVERARLSWDLPIVTLDNVTISTDSSGNFSATLPIAPDYIATSTIYVEARDDSGTVGSATFTVGRISNGPPITLTDDPDYQEYH